MMRWKRHWQMHWHMQIIMEDGESLLSELEKAGI